MMQQLVSWNSIQVSINDIFIQSPFIFSKNTLTVLRIPNKFIQNRPKIKVIYPFLVHM